jgi:hypothetical protein
MVREKRREYQEFAGKEGRVDDAQDAADVVQVCVEFQSLRRVSEMQIENTHKSKR